MSHSQRTNSRREVHGDAWEVAVFVTLGTLLLLAATLKSHQLIAYPSSMGSLCATLALICCELHLGTWLVFGSKNAGTWLLSLTSFLAFTAVSAVRWLSGAESCGCFGVITISPWAMLCIDGLAVCALLTCTPVRRVEADRLVWSPLRRLMPYTVVTFVAIAAMSLAAQQRFTTVGAIGESSSGLVVLNPEEWPGQRFPLLEHVRINADLAMGEWDVLLYRSNCHACHDAMLGIRQTFISGAPTESIALVCVESPQEDQLVESLRRAGCALGALSSDIEWFVTTPVRVLLQDGVCLEARVIDAWR